jgi:hypothetical protein
MESFVNDNLVPDSRNQHARGALDDEIGALSRGGERRP